MNEVAISSGSAPLASPEDIAVVASVPPLRSLAMQYDPITDIVVIEGIKFSGDFFRFFSTGQRGLLFRIGEREDGVVHLHRYRRGQTVYA